MIYVDPPYGIKFGSNWQVSTRKRDVKDAKAEDLTRQPEQVKAFRDTWESNCQMLWMTACSGGVGLFHPIDKPHPGDHLG
jgi:hypothetical protein